MQCYIWKYLLNILWINTYFITFFLWLFSTWITIPDINPLVWEGVSWCSLVSSYVSCTGRGHRPVNTLLHTSVRSFTTWCPLKLRHVLGHEISRNAGHTLSPARSDKCLLSLIHCMRIHFFVCLFIYRDNVNNYLTLMTADM